MQREEKFKVNADRLKALLHSARGALDQCRNSQNILAEEAKLAKQLYKLAANTVGYGDFTRAKQGSRTDLDNRFLDHGNTLSMVWAPPPPVLGGLPHGLAVLHGETRRGGLVFIETSW
jgi:CRISP-associated protein Cas1